MKLKSLPPFQDYTCYRIYHKEEDRYYVCLVPHWKYNRKTISMSKYLMSIKLRTLIDNSFDIHHINGNKKEDRIGNLKLIPFSQHIKLHAKGRLYVSLLCPICNKLFEKEKNKTHLIKKDKSYTTCSYSCSYKALRLKLYKSKIDLKYQFPIKEFRRVADGQQAVL